MNTDNAPPRAGDEAVVVVTNVEESLPLPPPPAGYRVVAGLAVEAVVAGDRDVATAWGLARLLVPADREVVLGEPSDLVKVEYTCVLPTRPGQHQRLARTLYPWLSWLWAAGATLAAEDLGLAFDTLTASSIGDDFPLTPDVVDAWTPAIVRDLRDRWQARHEDRPPLVRPDVVDLADLGQGRRRVWSRHHLCSFARWDETSLGIDGLVAASTGGDTHAEGRLTRLLLRNSLAAALVAARRIGVLTWPCIDLDALVAHVLATGERALRSGSWPGDGFTEPAAGPAGHGPGCRDIAALATVEPHGPFTGFPGMLMPNWYMHQLLYQPLVAVAASRDPATPPALRNLSAVAVQTTPDHKPVPGLVASWSIIRFQLPADGGPVPLELPQQVEYLCVHPHSARQAHDLAWALVAQLGEALAAGDLLVGHDLQRICDVVAASTMRDRSTLTRRQVRAWHDLGPTDGEDVLADLRRLASRATSDHGGVVFDLRHNLPTRPRRHRRSLSRLAAHNDLRSTALALGAVDVAGLVDRAARGDVDTQRQLHHRTLSHGLATALLAARGLGALTWDRHLDLDALAADLQRHGCLSIHNTANEQRTPVLARPELAPPPGLAATPAR